MGPASIGCPRERDVMRPSTRNGTIAAIIAALGGIAALLFLLEPGPATPRSAGEPAPDPTPSAMSAPGAESRPWLREVPAAAPAIRPRSNPASAGLRGRVVDDEGA